jgi:Tetratricopeptide repeat
VARKGAQALSADPSGVSASDVWREAVARAEGPRPGRSGEQWAPDEIWTSEPVADPSGEGFVDPRRGKVEMPSPATARDAASPYSGHRHTIPRPVVEEISSSAGTERGARLAQRMADAAYAYEKERYQDARRSLRALSSEVPGSPAVRELYGLVLYRSAQWAAAVKQLETFHELSGSYDQHPVLADCYRALRRYGDAERVWDELREASPSADLVAEGRIVAAGCRADRGDLPAAIAVLERSARKVRRPEDRHLRQWYALADLYERAGDLPRARELFSRVAAADPDAFDVRLRLRALR